MSEPIGDSLFQSAFEHAAIGMALVAPDGRWLRVNRALCALTGYDEAELGKLTFQDLTHPEDLDLDLARADQLLRGDIDSYQMEKRYFHKSGRILWVLLSVSLARNDDGSPRFFISQIKDITARKHAEAVNEAFFRLPVALHFVCGVDGFFKRLSPSWTEILGYSTKALLTKPWLDFVHPEDRARADAEAERLLREGGTSIFEDRFQHADGTYRWMLWTCALSRETEMIYGVARDYTARKEAELRLSEALREKEALLEDLRSSTQKIQELRDKLLTICAWTKQIRHDGQWISLDAFLSDHLDLKLTHGMSDEAAEKMLADFGRQQSSPD
jgi:PAS domain S-box-containing protein